MIRYIKKFANWVVTIFFNLSLLGYSELTYAQDSTGIAGVDDMIKGGQSLVGVAAKWGGITVVVIGALALGSGRLEGAAAQTICKVLIVFGLLIAATAYFAPLVTYGFSF